MNETDSLTHVSVFFTPIGDEGGKRTAVHLIHSGWRDAPEWEGPWTYFDNAWALCFKRLVQYVNEGAIPSAWHPRTGRQMRGALREEAV